MSRMNEREKLINIFIIKIFRNKADGVSKPIALIKLKKFISTNGKKWSSKLEDLFNNTWGKQIPAEMLQQFKKEDSERRAQEKLAKKLDAPPKIKPNKVLHVEVEDVPDKPMPARIMPNKKTRVREVDRFDEPDDIDDPKWDEELVEFLPKNPHVKCANCGETFTRTKEYRERMLCPDCKEKLQNSFNDSFDNFIYASEDEIKEQAPVSEKHRVLNIKPL